MLPAAVRVVRRGVWRLFRVSQVPHTRSARYLLTETSQEQGSSLGTDLTPSTCLCCIPVNLNFLFTYWALHRTSPDGARALQMALHTLKMMAYGGIHDHIAQVRGMGCQMVLSDAVSWEDHA